MLMNKNTIEFDAFTLDIPKVGKDQYTLLRQVFISIEKDRTIDKSYYFISDIFGKKSFSEIVELLKINIKLSITDKRNNEWYGSDVINDIKIIENKIFFRPASILREIVLQSKHSSKHASLKYILFNGIRYKQTLLFLDYMLNSEPCMFTLTLTEFKKIVELKETQYKNFNALNAAVIDRIIDDINTKTTYCIECTSNRQPDRKKVISVTFNYFDRNLNHG